MRYQIRSLFLLAMSIPLIRGYPQVGGLYPAYELVRTDLTVNEPVFLRFSVHNRAAEGVTVDMGANSFRGKIVRPDGREDTGPKPQPSQAAAIVRPNVAPGQSSSTVLLLSRWFDFDVPGRYFLDIRTTRPIMTDSGISYTYPLEASLIIDVAPRDAERLRRVCQEYLDKGTGASSTADTLTAADVLSNMRDPVAVPYLAKLLQDKERTVGYVVVEALRRLGGEGAAAALISHLGSRDPDLRNKVRWALSGIAAQTDDPAVRQKISDALR